MMQLAHRSIPVLGLLFAALVLPGPVRAAPPRGMGGMISSPVRSMMMAPGMSMIRAQPGMGNPVMPMGMGMGGVPSNSMPARSGYGSAGMNSGSMGSGNGYSTGSPMGSSVQLGSYTNPYDVSISTRSQDQHAKVGPLLGLLNAEGGLDWPLALRILPPETSTLRQQIDARAGEVQRQAAAGSVDAGLLRDLNRDVGQLREVLADRADRLPVSAQATEDARQFIRKLRDTLADIK
jgi:hypothetical protein